jgi:Tol biopolymer transport system component
MSGRLNFIEMRYSHIVPKAISALLLISIAALTSCEKDFVCVTYHIDAEPPYFDPVWHPSGEIIGFNHRPIRSIRYNSDIPCGEPEYSYSGNSAGFYIINSDGTGKRRILPYFLQTPAWSPTGDYIAFVSGAQIFKMPFDGEKFDTTAIEQLTFEGRNFFPSWSPDGEWIACSNTIGDTVGVWIIPTSGEPLKRYFSYGGKPVWSKSEMKVYYGNSGIWSKGYISEEESLLFNDEIHRIIRIKIDYTDNYIGFLMNGDKENGDNRTKIYLLNIANGEVEKLTEENIDGLSWSPDGDIVYLNFDYTIDEEKGTLWIIDPQTKAKRQLTYNDYEIFP